MFIFACSVYIKVPIIAEQPFFMERRYCVVSKVIQLWRSAVGQLQFGQNFVFLPMLSCFLTLNAQKVVKIVETNEFKLRDFIGKNEKILEILTKSVKFRLFFTKS